MASLALAQQALALACAAAGVAGVCVLAPRLYTASLAGAPPPASGVLLASLCIFFGAEALWWLRRSGAPPLRRDGVPLHVAASLVAGAVAAVVAAPFDVLKARAMSAAGEAGTLRGVLRGLAAEGGLPRSLFVGVLPAYLRLGPHALIAFPIFEQLRAAFGLSYL
jgi:hypothetical protein